MNTKTIAYTTEKNALLFFGAVILYLVGIILFYIISPVYAQMLQLVALVLFIWFGRQLIEKQIESKYFKSIFVLFILSNITIMLRTEAVNYSQLKDYLFSEFKFWPYLVPIVALFIKTPFLFYRVFNWIYWLGILFFIISIVCWKFYSKTPIVVEQAIWTFSSGSGFILLTWRYHNARKIIVACGSLLLALYISTILARRNIMLTNVNFFLFAFFSYLLFFKGDPSKKILSVYACIGVLFVGLLFVQQKKNTDFKLIFNRGSEDTREYVFYYFFEDIKNDMSIGRGVDGTYFCPLVTEDEEMIYRDLIECGYFQILLKGGVVNLVLFLALLLPASLLGILYSKNLFSKACGLIILLWLIDMVPYGLPCLSLRYILVWICVGVCYSKRIRQLSEDEAQNFITGQLTIN